MASDFDDGRRWYVGALADASGVTVRTLHHYDAVGLLHAGERTPAGHRRYTPGDVAQAVPDPCAPATRLFARLHRTGARPATGRVRPAGPADSQLAPIDARAAHLAEMRRRVATVLAHIGGPTPAPPEELLAVTEHMRPLPGTAEAFTPDQRDALHRRATELGPERVEALRADWLRLLAELRAHCEREHRSEIRRSGRSSPDGSASASACGQATAPSMTRSPPTSRRCGTTAAPPSVHSSMIASDGPTLRRSRPSSSTSTASATRRRMPMRPPRRAPRDASPS